MRVCEETDSVGEVGSIVSTVDDIIPDQWRNTRDEGLRGRARSTCGLPGGGGRGRRLTRMSADQETIF